MLLLWGGGGRDPDGRFAAALSPPGRLADKSRSTATDEHRPSRPVAARPVVLALVAALTMSCGSDGSTDERSAVYATLPTIAGAELIERTTYDLRADGEDTGRDGLRVIYRLPPASTAEEVLDELRAGLPDGWTEASDDTCARLAQDAPPPPVPTNADGSPGSSPTPGAAATALMLEDTELVAFTPGGERPDRWEGVTFTFVERGDEQLLVLDEPQLRCVPPGG